MASSPALPTQGATEEVTRKREVRLMKNRYGGGLLLSVQVFADAWEISQHPTWSLWDDSEAGNVPAGQATLQMPWEWI